jgi:hypothetical protein
MTVKELIKQLLDKSIDLDADPRLTIETDDGELLFMEISSVYYDSERGITIELEMEKF